MRRNSVFGLTLLGIILAAFLGWAQMPAPSPEEDHRPSILGLQVGMTAQQVLDSFGRMPDARKDEKGEIIVYWKLDKREVIQVRFRKDNFVSYISLQYSPFRPGSDLMLRPLGEAQADDPGTTVNVTPDLTGSGPGFAANRVTVGGSEDKVPVLSSASSASTPAAGKDSRWKAEYKPASTVDGERVVWARNLEVDPRFRIQVGFISASKARLNRRYDEEVEFKFVSVLKEDLKKFDKAMTQAKE